MSAVDGTFPRLRYLIAGLGSAFLLLAGVAAAETIRISNRWKPDQFLKIDGALTSGPIVSGSDADWEIEPAPEGFVRIRNVARPELYINIESDGPPVAGAIQPDWWSAMWTLESAEAGFVRIRNRWRPDRVLNIETGTLQASAAQDAWWSAMWSVAAPTIIGEPGPQSAQASSENGDTALGMATTGPPQTSSAPAQRPDQAIKPSDAFNLGYDMGVGSAQASVAVPTEGTSQGLTAGSLAAVSIGQAHEIVQRINGSAPGNGGALLSEDGGRISSAMYKPLNATQLANLYDSIVVLREAHTAVLAKVSVRLADLYVLGVNVGIAEAQATLGEEARSVVETALNSALANARSAGLPPAPLESALAALNRGAALSEVRMAIVSARSTYSNSL